MSILARLRRDSAGAVAAEAVLVLPLLTFTMYAIFRFGAAFHAQIVLADTARAAVRELAIGRESNSVYTDTMSRITGAAGILTRNQIASTLKVNGAACSSDTACKLLLQTAGGQTAEVQLTYPCNLNVLGMNFAPGCQLSSGLSQRIE